MTVVVLSASPNASGLTAACARAAVEGASGEGADAREIRLNGAGIGLCRACGDGWGTCRGEHRCQVEDGFQDVHCRVTEADALVLVTPVYWGEMSESAKALPTGSVAARAAPELRAGSRASPSSPWPPRADRAGGW